MRMAGHKGKEMTVHTKHYVHNPPSVCLVELAGGNHKEMKTFHPEPFMVTVMEDDLIQKLIVLLVPDLAQQYASISRCYNAATPSQRIAQ